MRDFARDGVLFPIPVLTEEEVARYRAAVANPALEAPGKALVQLGTIAALVLALAGAWLPASAQLAGLLALGTGAWLKFVLVTRASLNQGFALPRLPVRGAR